MKRNSFICIVAVLACFGLVFGSCQKDDPITPIDPTVDTADVIDTTVPIDTTITHLDTVATLLGHWIATDVNQLAGGNFVDMTSWYSNFQLIFEADGTLITTDNINTTEMGWTYANGIVGFIQVPGMPAIDYHIMYISADSLSLQDQRDPNYITTMNFKRYAE